VLVALIVLSVAVVAVLQLFGGGLRLARAATEHQEATLLADEKLTETTLDTLEEGVTEGTEGDFTRSPTPPSRRRCGWPGSASRSGGGATGRSSWRRSG
jgi:type II secretory pathway pseudopilin PulG